MTGQSKEHTPEHHAPTKNTRGLSNPPRIETTPDTPCRTATRVFCLRTRRHIGNIVYIRYMENLLETLIDRLESKLSAQERESEALGSPSLSGGSVTLLGQFALICQPEAAKLLKLRATFDVDAIIKARGGFQTHFREVVKELGFELDDLSEESWIPEGAVFNKLYEGQRFTISALDPISVLISKAVKAPERNRILVRDAIEIYGEMLTSKLKVHKVDLSFFTDEFTAQRRRKLKHDLDR